MGQDENYDLNLDLDGSVVNKSACKFPNQDGSNYQIVINNFLTSPPLLRLLLLDEKIIE